MEKIHPFRFGVVAAAARSPQDWLDRARRVESLGYATLVVPDNLQHTLAPLPALAMAAAVTTTLRVGTYVLANDFRNPVMLAKDVATLDLLSGGRFELGIGAGRPGVELENRMLGLTADSGGVRVARLAESLPIVKALLGGQKVTSDGAHYSMADAEVSPLPAKLPRILIAGSGRQMLKLAAHHADTIALGVSPDSSQAEIAEKIGWIREAAGERFSGIELNVNLMAVGDQVPRQMAAMYGLTAKALAERGAVAAVTGSLDEICEQLLSRRESLGLSYFLVADEMMEALAPVVQRLAGR